ncbi:homeobox protein PKNOX2 isoform X1 [Hippoglossus stenolepis]|uniref:homeobox protein PKNOX2 isoform X1 n=1 Tax=Hippoglossus stenolepis TaxID=195615 RepID=UPI00159C62E6|nr:homeobox protein PKNOX2 isoform X1 [Hippoglossus stenolepis]
MDTPKKHTHAYTHPQLHGLVLSTGGLLQSVPSGRLHGPRCLLCNYSQARLGLVQPRSNLSFTAALPEYLRSFPTLCRPLPEFCGSETHFLLEKAGILQVFKMSIAQAAAKAMLSDALLQHGSEINRISHLELELPLDKVIKFVSVGLPLMLVCMAFAREISLGPQISCFPPSNFTIKQASYVDTYCWDSLMHHEFDSEGNFEERSLWVHKMFPYSLMAMAVLMYLPALIWRQLVMPTLSSDLLFIIDELDKSYNRSIRLAQSILDMRQNTKNPLTFQAELKRAKKKRYFEYPLLERYMQCKQNSYFLVSMLFLRGFLLLTFMTAACLYLAYFHLSAFLQDEFSCFVRTGMLRDQNWVPELVQCKMIGQLVFQVISVANGAIYVLLAPIVLFSLIRLFVWDTTFMSVYEVLPALDLNRRRLGCPLNDLNVLMLFLRANVTHLKSYGKVRALCSLAPPQVGNTTAGQGLNAMLTQEEIEEREEAAMELAEEVEEAKEEGKLNLVDIMTILGAAQGRVVNCSEKRPLVEENMSLGTVTFIYTLKRILLVAIFVFIIWDVQKIIK